MGKIVGQIASMTTAAKIQPPTSDQLRIAQLLNNKSIDNDLMQEKIRKMMELTRCDENAASYALHDCGYDVDEAVERIFDGKFSSESEWTIQEGKKAKKLPPMQSSSEDFYENAEESLEFVKTPKNFGHLSNERRTTERNNNVRNTQKSRGRGVSRRSNAPRIDENEPQSMSENVSGRRRISNRGQGRGRGYDQRNNYSKSDEIRDDNPRTNGVEGKSTNRGQSSSWSNERRDDNNWTNNSSENVRLDVGEWKSGNVTSQKTKFNDSQASNSKTIPVNFDVCDWGGEEDWKAIPKEFLNSSTNNKTKPNTDLKIQATTYQTNMLATISERKTVENTRVEPNARESAVPSAAVPSTSAATLPSISPTFRKPDAHCQTATSRSSQTTAKNSEKFSQTSSVKVLMPVNLTPYGHIDVEFGEFGPVKSIGVDPSILFDFRSAPDYSVSTISSTAKLENNAMIQQNLTSSMNTNVGSLNNQQMNSFLSSNHSSMNDILSNSYPKASITNDFRQNTQPFVNQTKLGNDLLSTYSSTSGQQMQNFPSSFASTTANDVLSTMILTDSGTLADKEMALNQSKVSISGQGSTAQNCSGLGFLNPPSRNNVETAAQASKLQPSSSTNTLFTGSNVNQTSAAPAGVPYMYGADQSAYLNAALNAYGILSPQGNSYPIPFNPYDLNALRQMPPILNKIDATTNYRENNQVFSLNESKPQTNLNESRNGNQTTSLTSGIGLLSTNNANQQAAAQLAAAYHQYTYPFFAAQLMQVPQSVGPQATNTSGQFTKQPNAHQSTLFYGNNSDSRLQQDYSKQLYGNQPMYQNNQIKTSTNGVNYNMNNVDTNGRTFAPMKQFHDGKQTQNANLSPLGATQVGYHPSTAAQFGNYANYLPPQHYMANFLSQQSIANDVQRLNGGVDISSMYSVSGSKNGAPNQFWRA